MSEIKLKPCPFCGGEAILDREDIFCDCCHVSMRIDDRIYNGEAENHKQAVEQAIEAWNTRKPMDDIMAELKEKKDYARCRGGEEDDYYVGMRHAYGNAIEMIGKAGAT